VDAVLQIYLNNNNNTFYFKKAPFLTLGGRESGVRFTGEIELGVMLKAVKI